MQHFHWGQCGYMDPYGMHLHGLLRMENTKLIITTNHSMENSRISRRVVAPPTRLDGVDLCLPRPIDPVALAGNNVRPWIGFEVTIWCMIIAGTLKEITPLHQNVGASETIFLFVSYIHRMNITKRFVEAVGCIDGTRVNLL